MTRYRSLISGEEVNAQYAEAFPGRTAVIHDDGTEEDIMPRTKKGTFVKGKGGKAAKAAGRKGGKKSSGK